MGSAGSRTDASRLDRSFCWDSGPTSPRGARSARWPFPNPRLARAAGVPHMLTPYGVSTGRWQLPPVPAQRWRPWDARRSFRALRVVCQGTGGSDGSGLPSLTPEHVLAWATKVPLPLEGQAAPPGAEAPRRSGAGGAGRCRASTPAGPRPEGTGTLLTAACHRGAQGEVRRDSELTSVLPRERGLSSPRCLVRATVRGKARPQTQRAGARLSKGGLGTRIGGWRGTVPAGWHGDLGGLFPGSSLCCPCMSPVLTPKAEP